MIITFGEFSRYSLSVQPEGCSVWDALHPVERVLVQESGTIQGALEGLDHPFKGLIPRKGDAVILDGEFVPKWNGKGVPSLVLRDSPVIPD